MAPPPPQARRLRRLPRRELGGVAYPVATTPLSRLLGLALLDRANAGPGLVIPRCRGVHTCGMRFALDLVFLDEAWAVVSRRRSIPPGRVAREPGASAVLEIPTP